MICSAFYPLYPEDAFSNSFPRSREDLIALARKVAPLASELHVVVQLPPVEEGDRATEVARIELRQSAGNWRLQFLPCPNYCDQLTADIVPSADDIVGYLQDIVDGTSKLPIRIDSHEELWAAGVGPEALLDIRPSNAYPTLPLEVHCEKVRNFVAGA